MSLLFFPSFVTELSNSWIYPPYIYYCYQFYYLKNHCFHYRTFHNFCFAFLISNLNSSLNNFIIPFIIFSISLLFLQGKQYHQIIIDSLSLICNIDVLFPWTFILVSDIYFISFTAFSICMLNNNCERLHSCRLLFVFVPPFPNLPFLLKLLGPYEQSKIR